MTASPNDVPDFQLVLPDGWTRIRPDLAGEQEAIKRASAALRRYARPDLDFEFRLLLKSAFRRLEESRAVALFVPTDLPGDSVLPMSITASVLVDPAGGTLDAAVSDLFRGGATMLGDDTSVVRWERSVRGSAELQGADVDQLNYLIPIPGSGRRRGLLFSTSILLDPEASSASDADADGVDAVAGMRLLSDAIIATFAWRIPAGGRHD
ncbi:hypothetical protein [Agromyces seonyuensis]|uniref:Uncharacterized protein n=1 Tax=Agromyces seonyuensis TaxID=2662446 RepID=A0A6I4P4G7_9MICO|nr:hypothetical protein [Agromyces seonyuensis]MWB98194.1 hypothetical protein [Agromyces seonyuensis]